MLIIMILIASGLIMNNESEIFNFNTESQDWRIINDGVMGGLSQSNFTINDNGTATFAGTVLPDNNGGFASVRTLLENDIKERFNGVKIRVRGDGLVYNIRFRTDTSFDGYSYQAKFTTKSNEWSEHEIPFDDFSPTWRGRELFNKPVLEAINIKQIGILIADKQFGDFKLDIDWIKFY